MDLERRRQLADDARQRFENLYERRPSWEIGRPQRAMVELADAGAIGARVLDAGCGTGENALFLAARGHDVWGVDISPSAIGLARDRARARGLPPARFLAADALALDALGLRFDTVVDCGLLHALTDEEQAVYVAAVAAALEPGGLFAVLCFSEHEPGNAGPRRMRRDQLAALFGAGWVGLQIEQARFETNNHIEGAQAYLVRVRRAPGVP